MRKERETLEGFLYKTRGLHSPFDKDRLPDFSEELHEELNNPDPTGYYFISDGVVFHIDKEENIKKLDPILSNKVTRAASKKEPDGSKEIELLFLPDYKNTYSLKKVDKEEVHSISSFGVLFSDSVFGGRLFTCSDVNKYNYDNDKGLSLDKVILNQIYSSGKQEGSSVIGIDELLDLAKRGELYKARKINKINRESFR